jgi:hypothetical protein
VRVCGLLGEVEDSRAALLIACGVRQAGYKYSVVLGYEMQKFEGVFRAIIPGTVSNDFQTLFDG